MSKDALVDYYVDKIIEHAAVLTPEPFREKVEQNLRKMPPDLVLELALRSLQHESSEHLVSMLANIGDQFSHVGCRPYDGVDWDELLKLVDPDVGPEVSPLPAALCDGHAGMEVLPHCPACVAIEREEAELEAKRLRRRIDAVVEQGAGWMDPRDYHQALQILRGER